MTEFNQQIFRKTSNGGGKNNLSEKINELRNFNEEISKKINEYKNSNDLDSLRKLYDTQDFIDYDISKSLIEDLKELSGKTFNNDEDTNEMKDLFLESRKQVTSIKEAFLKSKQNKTEFWFIPKMKNGSAKNVYILDFSKGENPVIIFYPLNKYNIKMETIRI